MAKQTAGGKRKNAGRKKDEPKKAIGKRVPIKYHSKLVELVEKELQRLIEEDNHNFYRAGC
jgi:hypothetical protein